MGKRFALEQILVESGLTVTRAVHVRRVLDRLRLCGLGSDDYASALFLWRSNAVEKARADAAAFDRRPIGLPDVASLFEECPF